MAATARFAPSATGSCPRRSSGRHSSKRVHFHLISTASPPPFRRRLPTAFSPPFRRLPTAFPPPFPDHPLPPLPWSSFNCRSSTTALPPRFLVLPGDGSKDAATQGGVARVLGFNPGASFREWRANAAELCRDPNQQARERNIPPTISHLMSPARSSVQFPLGRRSSQSSI